MKIKTICNVVQIFFFVSFLCNCTVARKKNLEQPNSKQYNIVRKCKFTGIVVDILLKQEFSNGTLIVAADPQYLLKLDSIKMLEGECGYVENNNGEFAIHSPIKLFALEQTNIVNKRFLFELTEKKSMAFGHQFLNLEVITEE